MATARRRVVVHGRVQGVWFRESARRRATELAVGGWVRNRPDGAVEAEVEGDAEAVEVLVAWFGHGPSGAHVERLELVEQEPRGESGFTVTQ
jgi:acylphosphatase